MNIVNISKLGNTIQSLKVIGINDKGCLILAGSGNRVSLDSQYNRTEFYEYNLATGQLVENIFNDLVIFNLLISDYSLQNGEGCFLEIGTDGMINIVQCNFNHHTYDRLYSVCTAEEFNQYPFVFLKPLGTQYLALKMYSKLSCRMHLYDRHKRKIYDFVYPENEDMRYADFHLLDVEGVPHLLFIKYGKSCWKMEFFFHKWEWSDEFIKYKDEKIFLLSLEELESKPHIYLDDSSKIAETDENYRLHYQIFKDNCIVYALEDLRMFREVSLDDLETTNQNKDFYEHEICFYDINTKQTTNPIKYYGHLLVSNEDRFYEYRSDDNEQLVVTDVLENKVYHLPYHYPWLVEVINGCLILTISKGIIVYDFINEKEIGTYLSVNETSNVRYLPIELRYDYFKKQDLLVLF